MRFLSKISYKATKEHSGKEQKMLIKEILISIAVVAVPQLVILNFDPSKNLSSFILGLTIGVDLGWWGFRFFSDYRAKLITAEAARLNAETARMAEENAECKRQWERDMEGKRIKSQTFSQNIRGRIYNADNLECCPNCKTDTWAQVLTLDKKCPHCGWTRPNNC